YEKASMRFGTCEKCKEYNKRNEDNKCNEDSKYNENNKCNDDKSGYNYGFAFCHKHDISQQYSNKNDEIDNFIKVAQNKSKYYDKIIEWIPFERLENIEKIGEGGFGIVYSATWIDGKRKYVIEKNQVKISREQNCTVALKCLDSNDTSKFINEFKAYYECQRKRYDIEKYGLETYGITYKPDEPDKLGKGKYMMVFEYADKGDLGNYVSKNFAVLKWKQKIEILCSISDNLNHIHEQDYCHGDFHSGNILMTSVEDFKDLKIKTFTFGSKAVAISQNTGSKS
ncbi:1790_t:CDS:2, partial [Scutellospora calospora]